MCTRLWLGAGVDLDPSPRWLYVVIAGVGLLVLSIVIGGAINEGYQHSRDYVSALSSRGATWAWVGMLGLFGFAVANAATGMSLRAVSRFSMVAFVAAGVAGIITMFARIRCAGGAASCSLNESTAKDWLDQLHGSSVAVYQLCFLLGTCAAALAFARTRQTSMRATAFALAIAAIASAATVTAMPQTHPGGVQRVWLAINAATIVAIAVQGTSLTRELRASGTT